MGKKKQTEPAPAPNEERSEDLPAASMPTEVSGIGPALGELAREVEAFVAQRDQLAQRLHEEIAATEQKLAELRSTAASLFPGETGARTVAKDRRSKTNTSGKPAKRKPEPAAALPPANNESTKTSDEASSGSTAAPHEPHLD